MNEEILRRRDIFKGFVERELYQYKTNEQDISDTESNILTLYRADIEATLHLVRNQLQGWLMKYDTKDGYSIAYDEVLEHLSDRISKEIINK